MKIYEIILKPLTGFATSLKGDTIFGHICWQIALDRELFKKTTIDELLSDYSENPFAVFSSALPSKKKNGKRTYFLKRPDLPLKWLFENYSPENRKKLKERKWMVLTEGERITSLKKSSLYKEADLIKSFTQWRNKINRKTGTTGEEKFPPYSIKQEAYKEGIELVIFAGIDEKIISQEQLKEVFKRIGIYGFGKDASGGLGKFKVKEISEIDLNKLGSEPPNALYTLSPCVPEKNAYEKIYFTPFTRFGKHGDRLATAKNPFKNPVIMADEGAILIPKEKKVFEKQFIGRAVSGVSLTQPEAICQGYSLFIPVKFEEEH